MAGKRPTRSQLRSRRRALNSYLLSTESSYSDIAKQFGVKEDTVKKFLGLDTKTVRTRYNSSPGFRKLYNAAAKNHRSDLRNAARSEGKRYSEIPIPKRTYIPPQVVVKRRQAANVPKAEAARQRTLYEQARQLREYARNVERDYNAPVNRREREALDFQRKSFEKGRPRGLYEFLDTDPDEEDIEDYVDDVIENYHLSEAQATALSVRIGKYLGI